jgi:hypothetical protein
MTTWKTQIETTANQIKARYPDGIPEGIIDHYRLMRQASWENRHMGAYMRYAHMVKLLLSTGLPHETR